MEHAKYHKTIWSRGFKSTTTVFVFLLSVPTRPLCCCRFRYSCHNLPPPCFLCNTRPCRRGARTSIGHRSGTTEARRIHSRQMVEQVRFPETALFHHARIGVVYTVWSACLTVRLSVSRSHVPTAAEMPSWQLEHTTRYGNPAKQPVTKRAAAQLHATCEAQPRSILGTKRIA